MPSATEVIDDLGRSWSFVADSPARIQKEVQHAVRRWRFRKICAAQPSLAPQRCDVGDPACQSTVLVDFAGSIGSTVRTKAQKIDGLPWDSATRAAFVSAASGGQWPQARKAKVARWNITDSRCQLCLQAVGTEEHRHACAATRPEGGWAEPPNQAKLCLGRVAGDRKRLFRTRGLLALRLPAPPSHPGEWFHWLMPPPEMIPEDAIWYLDGSLIHGAWHQYRATGFGIVVVASRVVIACGNGIPPYWCDSASSAEAWALLTALRLSIGLPRMRTDCLVLLRVARAGLSEATKSSRPLARIWAGIGHALDGNIQALVDTGALVWMPAHQGLGAICNSSLSNGRTLTAVDWRANRLVDILAKQAASTRAAPKSVAVLLKSAQRAVRYTAALLGNVTREANHHGIDEVQDGGKLVRIYKRDAQQPASGSAARRPRSTTAAKAVPKPKVSPQPPQQPVQEPWAERDPRVTAKDLFMPRCVRTVSAAAKAASSHARREALRQEECTSQRIQQLGQAAQATPGRPTGASRLADIERRVRARLNQE